MTEKRFTKQEVYDGINRYKINESNFIVEILDEGIPMHYSTIVNRLNEQHKTITRLEKENEQLQHQLSQQEMEYATDLHRLAEENKQLKSQVKQLQHWNKCLAEKRHQELPYHNYNDCERKKEIEDLLKPKRMNCSDR